MSIQLQQQRPPFVEFKKVAIHDERTSNEKGYRVTKDVNFAFIMQPGSKDCFEIKAEDWLYSIKKKLINESMDAFPADWVDGFHRKYELWKQGIEGQIDGTPVREWPVVSPSQVNNLVACNIQSVEDVANMNEEAMQRVGMGSRDLKDKARLWLQERDRKMITNKENEELKNELKALKAQFEELLTAKEPKHKKAA